MYLKYVLVVCSAILLFFCTFMFFETKCVGFIANILDSYISEHMRFCIAGYHKQNAIEYLISNKYLWLGGELGEDVGAACYYGGVKVSVLRVEPLCRCDYKLEVFGLVT